MKVKYQQLYSNDCGKNALANLLNYYHIPFTNINIKQEEDGVSLKEMKSFLCLYFKKVEVVNFPIDNLKKVKHFIPYIALIKKDASSHYIVIYKKTKKYLFILDSTRNNSYKVSYETFKKFDSEIAIIPEDYKGMDLKILKNPLLLLLPFFSFGEAIFLLSTTILIQQIIDNGFNDALFYILIQLLLLLITTYKSKIFLKTFKDLNSNVVTKVYDLLFSLNDNYLKSFPKNELSYRLFDAIDYKNRILSFEFNIINDLILAITTFSLMFVYSFYLGLLVFIFCLIIFFISYFIFKKTSIMLEEKRKSDSIFLATYQKNLLDKNNYSLGKEQLITTLNNDYLLNKINIKKNLILTYLQSFLIFIIVFLYFTSFYKYISVGSLIALINLVSLVLQPTLNITSEIVSFANFKLIQARLIDLINNQKEN